MLKIQEVTVIRLARFVLGSVLLVVLAFPLTVFAQDDMLPDVVMAARPGYHPEGVEWDAAGERFLTGSLTEGGAFAVADDGTVTRLVEAHEGLASVGIHVDAERNRLLVAMSDFAATSDPSASGVAALGSYDLETGDELFFVTLSDLMMEDTRHFANDVTVDADGYAYVTDSFSPVIYTVDPDGNAEIFLESDEFAVEGFGLNGIDYHPDGNFLLVAVAGKGAIYKVPVDDPAALTQVELSEMLGVDGMVLNEDGDLIAVATTFNEDGSQQRELVQITSGDDWATAEVVARGEAVPEYSPTTVALRDGVPYVVHAHFGDMGSETPVEAFEILRVDLAEMGM
jgi:sugar lactone lactonase YvrE